MISERVRANSFHRVNLDGLYIVSDLIGATHRFRFNGHRMAISIPVLREQSNDRPDYDGPLVRYAWHVEGKTPTEYRVNWIDLRVFIDGAVDVPKKALEVPPKRPALFSQNQQRFFESTMADHQRVAAKAFAHWCSTIRWISGIASVAEPAMQAASFNLVALQRTSDGHRFWTPPHMLAGQLHEALTLEDWNETQNALRKASPPPVSADFLFEASHRLSNGDFVGAVLTMAISLEAAVRYVLTTGLHASARVDPLFYDVIGQVNIRYVLRRIKKLAIWDANWKEATDFAKLHELMDLRDKAMHEAATTNLDRKQLRQLFVVVKKFVYYAHTQRAPRR